MSQRPHVGQVVAGHRLQRAIGEGALGSVFLAEAPDGAVVALKVVTLATGEASAAAAHAFLDAAGVARRLQHPGIVAVHAAGVAQGRGWLAMEPVPGTDLARYTHPARLLPEPLVLLAAARVARALAYAHRQGVVHRDLKPANVLVHWPSDTVKLADFGLARAADATQTRTGLVPGSPAYMAPELLAGAVPTPSGDFYALGAMLYQLLAGRMPFEAASMGELLRRVARDPAPDLRLLRPDLPAATARLVARLLAKSAAERPHDGDAVGAEIDAIRGRLAAPG